MKHIKKMISITFMMLFLVVLASCGDKSYTVTFDTLGGSVVASQEVLENGFATMPDDPSRDGYVFNYWYQANQDQAYDFDTPVTSDLTITALWVADADLIVVSFNSNGGTDVADILVISGRTITAPEAPTKAESVFDYWYLTDESQAFDFNTAITEDIILNAYWAPETFTVAFDTDGGSSVESQLVAIHQVATAPEDPTKDGYIFDYWYVESNPSKAFDFATQISADVTLYAKWIDAADVERLQADITDVEDNFYNTEYNLNIPSSGRINGTSILWYSTSDYISKTGVVLPVRYGDTTTQASVTIIYSLNGLSETKTYTVDLNLVDDVTITNSREVNFYNTTPEYDVVDSSLTLYFEENGYVPYVKVMDFFTLLQGFIDPSITITDSTDNGVLTLEYTYTDPDDGTVYDLICILDSNTNTITTNDPGFYWAYVYSTATNYGRHIVYDTENPNAYYQEGHDVFYDLNMYNLDMAVYEGDVVLPYYLVNQLFAGSSYYNVYYNYDALYGIYSLPSEDSDEYAQMMDSTMQATSIPSDLLVHTYNMFAFDLDYFYGLKDIMEVNTYYDELAVYMDDLLDARAYKVDDAISKVLLKGLDEPHTSYGYPSYFNVANYSGPATSSLANYGPRFNDWYKGLVAVDDAIGAKWGEAVSGWNANAGYRPYYWFLDTEKTTAVLTLDDFNTSDIEESATYNDTYTSDTLNLVSATDVLPAVDGGNKYFFYNNSTDTNRYLEILVKGLNSTYVQTYQSALVALGYTLSTDSESTAYYAKTVNDVTYTVQVSFDETYGLFYVGIYDSGLVDNVVPFEMSIIDTVIADSAVYMEVMLETMSAEAPNLANVVLDLSWNMGGNIGALYRVVGFITDQAFATSRMNRSTGSVSTSYVRIEGIDSYSQLNWSLLTSTVTFSAANEMATIFKENNLGTVIGQQSGGGACSITPILLPNGTAFTTSSNSINAYIVSGSGTEADPYVYESNEFGIVPDQIIAVSDLYNETVLLNIINPA